MEQKTIIKQLENTIDTFCKKCKKKRTIKFITERDYTIMCNCGCEVYRYYDADEFHEKAFYTRNFISKREFNKRLHEKRGFEKLGFSYKNGKWIKNVD